MPVALIVTTDLGGNLPPLLGVGGALERRGWDVVVHTDSGSVARVAASGLTTTTANATVAYDPRRTRSTLESLRDVPPFWADRGRGRDAVRAARRIRADVAVVDVLLVGALAELEEAGIPTVVVAHSTWEGVRTFLGGPLGLRLRLLGAPPSKILDRADRILIASDEGLGRHVATPRNAVTTGPVLQETPPPRSEPREGLLLLSLSTVAFPGQRAVLQRLLDGAAGLPVQVLAATAGVPDPEGLRTGPNTALVPLLDHGVLLPRATAIVSHGGHATTVRALAHGVPMVLVPLHPLMDQPRIARAVVAAGAGLALRRSARPERIATATSEVLDEPRFARSAAIVGARLVAADGAGRAVDEIEDVIARAAGRTRVA